MVSIPSIIGVEDDRPRRSFYMPMASRPITNDKIYELVNSARLELKGDIRDLRNQFDTLEAGRLTRLEAKMNDFEISQVKKDGILSQNQAVLSTKFVIIGAIAIMLLTGLASAFWNKVLR